MWLGTNIKSETIKIKLRVVIASFISTVGGINTELFFFCGIYIIGDFKWIGLSAIMRVHVYDKNAPGWR